ncbi:hypothetical protein LTR70_003198 [Exophiala xenobiotica]|uniref:Zn(2)-C6 fungal-type domain-containing protein n=1 Tax=Lithohypha guttulata TaxID=1690604 RepID=A0ABR0KGM9_9EURO|nr:hypothetical protein LTR24_002843 [Lithohypha guttulata]KAK5323710.1 hypothetical protein LTR70_003198 [Exophiala xenobiotica]
MAAEKKQITRNRTSYSCQMCRRRKIKCDKTRPVCGACQKVGEECVYVDADKAPALQAAQQALPVREDESRKRRAIEDSYNGDDAMPSLGIRAIEHKLNQLSSLMRDINGLTSVSDGSSPGDSHSSDVSTTSGHVIAEAAPNGHSSHGAHYGISDANTTDCEAPWANVLVKLDQLNDLLRSGMQAHPPFNRGRSAKETREADLPQSSIRVNAAAAVDSASTALQSFGNDVTGTSLSEKDMLAPTEEESSVLFRSWLFSIYPILPIVSPRVVLQKYEAFNQWYRHGMDRGEPNPDPSFMPYLTLIWYTGYINLSDRARNKWLPWANNGSFWAGTLRARLQRQLEIMKSEVTPSVWTLAASVTGQHLAIGGQEVMSNCVRNTLNTRAAQSLGLHSEKALKTLSATEAEMKRRLWWETVTLDTAISTVSGMPVVLDEVYTDTKMISELKEIIIGTTEAEEYEEHLREPGTQPDRPDDPADCQTSSLVSVYHLTMKARYILTATTKKVLKANMRAEPMTMDELKDLRKLLARTSKEVHAIINRIPCRGVPELDFTPEVDGAAADLDHLDSMESPVTEHEIGSFLQDRELRKFRWAWSSMYHPMHATIILLIDLHDRPHSDEAPRSRAMIDRMFSLGSPEKGLVDDKFTAVPLKEGGTEAWTMLQKLRHRAWQKAGLDPDVLWSEDDQMSVGVGKPLSENDLFTRSLREDIILSHKQRRIRQGFEQTSEPTFRQLFSRAAVRDATQQYRHPSILGPGDRVEGSMVRELADLDIGPDIPPILLLQASHDQELMPYSLNNVNIQPSTSQQVGLEGNGASLLTRPTPGTEGAEIFHIGELIKKIRKSHPNRISNQELPTSTSRDISGPQVQLEKGSCNFRAVKEVENAVFQDLQEQHSKSGRLSKNDNRTHVPTFGNPTAPGFPLYHIPTEPTFEGSKTNEAAALHIATLQGQSSPIRNQTTVLQHASSTVPVLNSLGFLGMMVPQVSLTSKYATSSQVAHAPTQAQVQAQPPSATIDTSSIDYLASTELNDTSITDVDFDWEKWDETFGHYGGFEDMLMDESGLLHDGSWTEEMQLPHLDP